MDRTPTTLERPVWFVGATWHDHQPPDQTERFLTNGMWENGYDNRHLDDVKSVRPGDRIVIKSTYTRKQGLPFDNRGVPVSALKIKAVGEVTENPGDGRKLKVAWKPVLPPREWYFYTHRRTVWKVQRSSGASSKADALIRFALDSEKQDFDIFLPEVGWDAFFSEIADKLLQYRNEDRGPLITKLIAISRSVGMKFPNDRFADGTEGKLRDICPFSTFGCFNRKMADTKRDSFANELASFLQVRRRPPTLNSNEDGVPTLDPMRTWFFSHAKDRNPDDIDSLWTLFADAIKLADASDEDDYSDRAAFIRSYDKSGGVKGVGATTLTIGLYWIRPWSFPPLDKLSIRYMNENLGEQVPEKPNARNYLELRDRLLERFDDPDAPVHSFPELTRSAYAEPPTARGRAGQGAPRPIDNGPERPPPAEYTIDQILGDGCFLSREAIEKVIGRLRIRKNLILQGPPGTGKTWLAKRLAFALLGHRDEGRVRHLQFHPNLSYEDFVRGHRPVEGRLELTDGPFLEVTRGARDDPEHAYVMVIEEINRGNPAQIFGEMLTLLEADKRTPDEALALAFPRGEHERVHVPPNVYLIGTMNVADRSLALVDLALRRRFAFVDLEPVFGESWRRWMRDQGGFDDGLLGKVADRMDALNQAISADASLGKQFRMGHSYLTVPPETRIANPEAWYREVVEMEIGPLLREYWFDQPAKADAQEKHLLADL